MSNFLEFKKAVNEQLEFMAQYPLFTVNVDKNELWDIYLNSFPKGTNPIYKERTEHDCQCCKQFIRDAGKIVAIIGNDLVSIWDILINDPTYQLVAHKLKKHIHSKNINNILLHRQNDLGTNHNHQQLENGSVKTWEHFHYRLPNRFVAKNNRETKRSKARANKEVFKRGLDEITMDSINIVLELIDQNSLYRGQDYKVLLTEFLSHKAKYLTLTSPKLADLYCWRESIELGTLSKIRNTAIGTLLVALSDGTDLDIAVRAFESIMAPENYKRPTALITKGMITKAEEKVKELGIESSLQRRYANLDDITINNILFIDRTVKEEMGIFDKLAKNVPVNTSKLTKIEKVGIGKFLTDILPKANSLELMFDNKHSNNLMSLIAPTNIDSPNILKWNNNFSWSYNGEVTDSMKERVKSAGGSISGVLRFSIQWNENGNDENNDLDAHCKLSNGAHIYFSDKHDHGSNGSLDVDITNPKSQTSKGIAVENITWPSLAKMPDGEYHFYVHNYARRNTNGFRAEIEMNGEIHEFDYRNSVTGNVTVAVVTLKNGQFTIEPSLPSSKSSVEHYGINTQQFHKVNMIMNSPNHWDDQVTGNKHWFFILDGCNNPTKARGFYNEFLKNELTENRKVFEVLSSKMKTEPTTNQLSGLGFSSTQRNSVICKVTGSFNRTIEITF